MTLIARCIQCIHATCSRCRCCIAAHNQWLGIGKSACICEDMKMPNQGPELRFRSCVYHLYIGYKFGAYVTDLKILLGLTLLRNRFISQIYDDLFSVGQHYFGSTGISIVRYVFHVFLGRLRDLTLRFWREIYIHPPIYQKELLQFHVLLWWNVNKLMLQMLCLHTDW